MKIDPSMDAPPREMLDFSTFEGVQAYCEQRHFDIIIHAGAITNKFNEKVDEEYIRSNIIGTANIVLWCMKRGIRLVYISSDYVYPGEQGGYSEESVLLPVNRYAKSKLGGEMSVQLYDDSLIIRTSFYSDLAFPRACTDQYTSRISIVDAAKAIYKLAKLDHVRGVINLGSKSRRSLYQIVRDEFNPSMTACKRKDIRISYPIPPDSSLNTDRYYRMIEAPVLEPKTPHSCRVCGSSALYKYLDLGVMPLPNSYLREEDLSFAEFKEELTLQLCENCGLSQLTKVVPPDLMFRNYLYVSSTTETIRKHCEEFAKTSVEAAGAKEGDLVLDIASNDGCLLSQFRELGMKVLGVDPAENLAKEANAAGITTLCYYWSKNIAKDIASRFGPPKVITAMNVFGHVEDVHEFVEAVADYMATGATFIIECPYICDFIDNCEFDTAYHEHLSYFGIHPLSVVMRMHGLEIFDVDYFAEIHGGTIRVFVSRVGDYAINPRVEQFMKREKDFGIKNRAVYESFAEKVSKNKQKMRAILQREYGKGKVIWAYGASAKGNTLMNYLGVTSDLVPAVIDDNEKKWGLYAPGSHMRIVGIEELRKHKIDHLLLLAWNFKKEIVQRCQATGYTGSFILPVPEPKVVYH